MLLNSVGLPSMEHAVTDCSEPTLDISASLFCSASYLAMGHHFQRLVGKVPDLIENKMYKGPEDPSLRECTFLDLEGLGDFAVDNHARFQQWTNTTSTLNYKNNNVASDQSKRAACERWTELVSCIRVTSCQCLVTCE